jgi:hypothetical protein
MEDVNQEYVIIIENFGGRYKATRKGECYHFTDEDGDNRVIHFTRLVRAWKLVKGKLIAKFIDYGYSVSYDLLP